MTPDQKKELKNEIKKRIKELKLNIKSLKKVTKPIGPDRALGKVGRIDAIQIKGIQEANLAQSCESLCKLEETLKLIDKPGFGICYYCKKEIGFERIKALPESNRCIECADRFMG